MDDKVVKGRFGSVGAEPPRIEQGRKRYGVTISVQVTRSTPVQTQQGQAWAKEAAFGIEEQTQDYDYVEAVKLALGKIIAFLDSQAEVAEQYSGRGIIDSPSG